MPSAHPDTALKRLRQICLALPESGERLSHGAPVFDVAGKMFAYFRHDHHGDGRTVVCVRTGGRDQQDLLLELDSELYSWPAYIGPSGWIAVNLEPANTDWAHINDHIRSSYRLAAPRRLADGMDAAG